MSAPEGIGGARLTVLLHLRDPASYLALGPAVAFGEELGIAIAWLPVTVPPLRPPTVAAAGDDRGVRHRRARAQAIAREIEVYGRAQGLVLRDLYRDVDTRAFDLGWLWLRATRPASVPAYLRAGFRAYWESALDPSSLPAIADLLSQAGADPAGFADWARREGDAAAEAIAAEVRERGISGAPGYLVDGEVFIGRQHLPMIRWILAGRQGPGPI